MAEPPVLVEKQEGGVGLLTLNRPKTLNSWTGLMANCLWNGLDQFAADPEVRVIIITGAGRAFCAGADMGGLEADAGGDSSAFDAGKDAGKPVKPRLITYATTIPKPVIAAINGPAAGLGLAIACTCDFRFAARDAKLTSAFSKLGLIAEHGLSWALPHFVGTGNAMRMLMGSDVVTGEEAMQMGLVQRCFNKDDVLKETIAYAKNLAATVPANNLAVIKQQVWRHPLMERDDALKSTNRLMHVSTRDNPDYKEGVRAFMSKTPAKWTPLDLNSSMVLAADKEFTPKSKL